MTTPIKFHLFLTSKTTSLSFNEVVASSTPNIQLVCNLPLSSPYLSLLLLPSYTHSHLPAYLFLTFTFWRFSYVQFQLRTINTNKVDDWFQGIKPHEHVVLGVDASKRMILGSADNQYDFFLLEALKYFGDRGMTSSPPSSSRLRIPLFFLLYGSTF